MVIATRQHELDKPLTVLVTGAASGIGLAQARAFLDAGHQVFGYDQQFQSQWNEWQQAYPTAFDYLVGDITNADAIIAALQQLLARFGKLDVLCNTAGVLDDFKKLGDTTMSAWQHVLDINVTGTMMVAYYALPYLLARPAARIINMASIASFTAGGGGIAYTTAKHAVAGFTKQLAYEYATTGLRVNAIAPGAIQTAMTAADFALDQGTMAQWVANQVPTKRWAQPEEVAQLTLFLASDASDYMNGTIIPFDGGWMVR